MANSNFKRAKAAKNDEFYTQYHDIETEMNAYLEYDPDVFRGKTVLLPCDDPEWSNFTRYFVARFRDLGLKKLISTSYAQASKHYQGDAYQPTLFEMDSPQFDPEQSPIKGKIFTLTPESYEREHPLPKDLKWAYLEGDGDFRSEEVTALRDEADIVVTNPPFSLFREFLSWLIEGKKQFAIIGNMNAITYKEVFPLIKENKIWLGVKSTSRAMFFKTPNEEYKARVSSNKPEGSWWRNIDGEVHIGINNSCWYTNLEHGRRHEPLMLMTMADNLRYHPKLRGKTAYDRYDNYDAIEVPKTDAIPKDYPGVMGVPISFLDKYCPEQFEILGLGIANLGLSVGVKPYKPEHKKYRKEIQGKGAVDGDLYMIKDGEVVVPYARILLRWIKEAMP